MSAGNYLDDNETTEMFEDKMVMEDEVKKLENASPRNDVAVQLAKLRVVLQDIAMLMAERLLIEQARFNGH